MNSASAAAYWPLCSATTIGQISTRRITQMRLGRWRTSRRACWPSARGLIAEHHPLSAAGGAHQARRTGQLLLDSRGAAAGRHVEGHTATLSRHDVGAAYT